jgi:RNA polymerase sigma-70 factor (ECF subfamily)
MTSVPQDDRVSEAWRADRAYLVDLAYRMLGDVETAEDIVQEAFSRLLQAGPEEIADARGWLIVVTSRLCLDHIKSARSRRERAADVDAIDHGRFLIPSSVDPADRITLDENVRLALVVVLERLSPAERVVFVLHDIFQMPFDVVAETVGRTPAGCRQLARRARLKIEAAQGETPLGTEAAEYRTVTDTFIAACATGDLDTLLTVLDPQVSGGVDLRPGLVVVGSERVARNLLHFWGRPEVNLVSQPVVGQASLLGFVERRLAAIFLLELNDVGRITEIHVLAEPAKLEFVQSRLSLGAAR